MGTSKAANDTCDAAALSDFNAVRASEGLGPMTLPADFDTLAVPYQLLAISDIERVDRGLPPILGLTAALNQRALDGANADNDPSFPSPFGQYGTSGSANWAGAGNSALLDDFFWMYDDGLGSFNGDCTASDQSGCWGHRDDILLSASSPAVMGAASVPDATYKSSMAEEFIGGYKKLANDPVLEPSWATISASSPPTATPVQLSATSKTVNVDTDKSGTTTVTVTAPAAGASVSAAISAGGDAWSVTPANCTLAANASCDLTLTFDPPSTGTHNGTLTVTDGTGDQTVSLSGYQGAPRIAVAVSKKKVQSGKRVKITTTVTAQAAQTPIAGQSVELQLRHGSGAWQEVAPTTTNASGVAVFSLHPTASANYRVEARSASNSNEGDSASVRIKVV